MSEQHPLILTRMDLVDPRVGETAEGLSTAERLLRCEHPSAHEAIAAALWDSLSDADALSALENVGREQVVVWEEEVRAGGRGGDASRGGGLGVGGPEGGREGKGGKGKGRREGRGDGDEELERG